jgi:MFS transporter, DHA1 family, tetracycline resistance protein
VSVSEQGQLQGANASIQSICGIFAPALFTQTFAATLDRMPGAAFILAAAMLALAMAIGWRVTKAEPGTAASRP